MTGMNCVAWKMIAKTFAELLSIAVMAGKITPRA